LIGELKLIHVFFLILIVFNVILITKITILNKLVANQEETFSFLRNEIDYYKNKILIERKNDNYVIDRYLKLINLYGDTIYLKDIVDDKKLIFRYSVLDCDACANVEFDNIKSFITKSKFDLNDFILLVYYKNLSDLIKSYRALEIDIPIYIVPNNNLNLPIDAEGIPYYFVIDTTFSISNLFIPKRTEINLTQHFFDQVIRFIN
jgi:hypothetical protein